MFSSLSECARSSRVRSKSRRSHVSYSSSLLREKLAEAEAEFRETTVLQAFKEKEMELERRQQEHEIEQRRR